MSITDPWIVAQPTPAQPWAADPHASALWADLQIRATAYRTQFDMRTAFAQDPHRVTHLGIEAPYIFADMSKQLWDPSVLADLVQLAEARGLSDRRDALWQGEVVNQSQQKPALHVVWRQLHHRGLSGVASLLQDTEPEYRRMQAIAAGIRANESIQDLIHLGTGGSGLGPQLAIEALSPVGRTPRIHLVANLDPDDLGSVLSRCEPAHTVFSIASQSWRTAETLANTQAAWAWLAAAGCEPADHMIAITAEPDAAKAHGMRTVLQIPPHIGGRFSLWTAVGFPVAVWIGPDGFTQMMAGAWAMDQHFAQIPFSRNLPVCLGLLDVWCSSLLGMGSRCIVPYAHRLRRWPAYIQQLEMESNGKRVNQWGDPIPYPTAAAVWGEVGSNSQHAFFQWLHQGTQRIPVELIGIVPSDGPADPLPVWAASQHQHMLIHMVAQSQALLWGNHAEPRATLSGHRYFPGNRPSTCMLITRWGPEAFGAWIALHEHRVFVSGTIWGINSFDQWGVELGKKLAEDWTVAIRRGAGSPPVWDPSSAGLLARMGIAIGDPIPKEEH